MNNDNEINNILSSQYKFSQEDILNNFNEHKKKINADNKNFDKWIREGYTLNSKEICPYCGNSLQGNKLVESYVVMFCENFIQYTKDVERLQNIKTSTSQFDELKNIINSSKGIIHKIKYNNEVSLSLQPGIPHKLFRAIISN